MRRESFRESDAVQKPVLTLGLPEAAGGTWSADWRELLVRVRRLSPGESAGVGAVGIDAADLERSVSRGLLNLPLLVRTRRPGDVFRPSGVGTKKLKDFLMDARIPAEVRDGLPLLTDSGAEVLFVIGRRESSWLARTAGSQGGWEVAFLRKERPAEPLAARRLGD